MWSFATCILAQSCEEQSLCENFCYMHPHTKLWRAITMWSFTTCIPTQSSSDKVPSWVATSENAFVKHVNLIFHKYDMYNVYTIHDIEYGFLKINLSTLTIYILGLIAFSGPHLLDLYARSSALFSSISSIMLCLFRVKTFEKVRSHFLHSSSQTWVMLLVLHPLPRAPTHWPLTLVCLN